jgi:AraC family L-rhamnose operon transcriptional activator RhaR
VVSTIPNAGVFKDPQLPLSIDRASVNWPIAEHAHEFQELCYVEKGRALHEVVLGDGRPQRYELLPGDCFIIAPGERHTYVSAKHLVVWNIIFLPDLIGDERARLDRLPGFTGFLFLEPLFRHETGGMLKLHLDVAARERVLAALNAMRAERKARAEGYAVAARAQFLVLLVELARAWAGREKRATAPAAGQRQAIDAAIAFMEERYGEELSLKDIAAQAYLSPHHFSETFKRACGMPPWEFLLRLRLDHAKQLLRVTSRSVTDIALSVGFADSSYFARVFKAEVGATPRAWRESQGAAPE